MSNFLDNMTSWKIALIGLTILGGIPLIMTVMWLFLFEIPARKQAFQQEYDLCHRQGGSWQHNLQSSDACWVNGKLQWFSKLQ